MLLGESINHVRRGQFDARVANEVGYLGSILPGALQQGLLEWRGICAPDIVIPKMSSSIADSSQSSVSAEEAAWVIAVYLGH